MAFLKIESRPHMVPSVLVTIACSHCDGNGVRKSTIGDWKVVHCHECRGFGVISLERERQHLQRLHDATQATGMRWFNGRG